MSPRWATDESRFSPCRVAWALCLLACCGFVAMAVRTYGEHRDWWDTVQSELWRYAHWTTMAQREAHALVGDVEGLTRQQVVERLTARLGPDDPYPTPPLPAGSSWPALAPSGPEDPLREPPVWWAVRSKNWNIIVPIYDGRAETLDVTTLKPVFFGTRAPRANWEVPLYTTVACYLAMVVAAFAAGVLWWLRLNYRAAAHACLMAAVLASAAVLFTDWQMGAGLDWQPLVLGGPLRGVFWEGQVMGLMFGLIALRVPPRRPLPGVCANCRYDLTGNQSGVCPECGTAINPPLAKPDSPPAPAAIVG